MNPIEFFKALADDTRLRSVLLILSEQELCVCELTEALDESQPKISRHLAQLRQSGLLLDRRQGQWVFYRINPELPAWAAAVLEESTNGNRDYLKQGIDRLQNMGERPQRLQACC